MLPTPTSTLSTRSSSRQQPPKLNPMVSLVRPPATTSASSTLQISIPKLSTTSVACPNMLAALLSSPAKTSPTGSAAMNVTAANSTTTSTPTTTSATTTSASLPSSVLPGTKDSDGFLTPPPASTLLLRRTRLNSSGTSTYIIASGASTNTPGGTSAAAPSGSSSPTATGTPTIDPSLTAESSSGRSGSRSTSGRSIKRPKFDDERVPTNTTRRKDSPLLGTIQQPQVIIPNDKSILAEFRRPGGTGSPMAEEIEEEKESASNSGLTGSSDSEDSMSAATPQPSLASNSDVPLKGIPKPKVSKGKPASFMAASAAVLKKQRKERSPEKNKNVDPRTGKRRYIKKKDFCGDERPFFGFGRTISQSSDVSVASEPVPTWRPADDLRLLINVKQTCDLKMVHIGTVFSCAFTLEHIETRWKSLLYDRSVSKVSQMAIMNMHSQFRTEILSKALYSKAEDDLIKSVRSTAEKSTVLQKLEELLKMNPQIFIKWRTVDDLWEHWKELKEFHLLCDQSLRQHYAHESFEDIEESMNDEDVMSENLDSAVYQEVLIENKHMRKKIRLAEEELAPWKIMAEIAAEIEPLKGEDTAFATIRGENVRYLMRSREISIGKYADGNVVDIDLSLEGSTYKVSRRQGVIQLRNSGNFVFQNIGKHTVFLDGEALLPQHIGRLRDQSVIQISGLRFVFLINQKVVEIVRAKLKEDMANLRNYEMNGTQRKTVLRTLGPMGQHIASPNPSLNSPVLAGLGVGTSGSSPTWFNARARQALQFQQIQKAKQSGAGTGMYALTNVRIRGPNIMGMGFLHTTPAAAARLGAIGKPGFPHMPTPTPTIFRRTSQSGTVEGPGIAQPSLSQPSYQIGDLTIRPGVPPSQPN